MKYLVVEEPQNILNSFIKRKLTNMIKITNKTDKVIVIYNDNFEKEIPINQIEIIEDDEISSNREVNFKYFSSKGEQKEITAKEESFGGRYYLDYENRSIFLLETKVDIGKSSEIILTNKETKLSCINFLFLKTLCLKNISPNIDAKQTNYFSSNANKQKCIHFLIFDVIIYSILAILALFGLPIILISNENFTTKASFIIILIIVIVIWLKHLYIFIKVIKTKYKNYQD